MSHWLNESLYRWQPISQITPVSQGQPGEIIPANRTEFFRDLNKLVALNENVLLIKYDPETLTEGNMRIATGVDFFYDFQVYEFPRPSMIRSYPLRLLYSSALGKAFMLEGTNTPVYAMMRQLYFNNFKHQNKNDEDRQIADWALLYLRDYVRFFFDNVKGRHGRFELVTTFEEIADRIRAHYVHEAKVKKDDSLLETQPLTEDDRLLMGKLIQFLEKHSCTIEQAKNSVNVKNQLMIFRNSLFKVNVSFKTTENNFGMIELDSEMVLCLSNGELLFSVSEEPLQISLAITAYLRNTQEKNADTDRTPY